METMEANEIQAKLDNLSDLRQKISDMEAQRQAAIREAMKPVMAEIDRIELQYLDPIGKLRELEAKLAEEIKSMVITLGETIKGTTLMAVYNKGRDTWDSTMLKGLALAHPEIKGAMKTGEPSVTIRGIK